MPPTIITKESLYKRITELERKHCCGKNQFFDSFEDFPDEGQKGILYIDESTGDIYVWVVDAFVLAGDKFHSNIVGTGAYDALLPLTNWTPPSGAIEGNTAQVKFTDGIVVNYTHNGTTWVVDFVDDAAVSGTGVTNRVAFWSDPNTLGSDADLYWDDVNNRLGVGTTNPAGKLDITDTTLAGSGSLNGSALNITQTFNTTGSPTAIKLNVTNTTSGSSSKLMDLQAGGQSVLSVQPLSNGIGGAVSIRNPSANNSNFLLTLQNYAGSNIFIISANGSVSYFNDQDFGSNNIIIGSGQSVRLQPNGFYTYSTGNIGWSATTHAYDAMDTNISRGGVNKLYVGNGTVGDATGTLIAGNVGIGTTSPSTKLHVLSEDNTTAATIAINATQANVTASDAFLAFTSTSGIEGSIAGTAVAGVIAYNTFTGSHYSQSNNIEQKPIKVISYQKSREYKEKIKEEDTWIDGVFKEGEVIFEDTVGEEVITEVEVDVYDTTLIPGTVLCSTNEMCEWQGEDNATLPKCRVSDSPMDKAVYGVYGGHDRDGDIFVLGIGTGIVLVNEEGGKIEIGDFLCTSSTPGQAMRYDGNDMRVVLAKARENFEGESRAIAVTLLAG